MPTKSQAKNFDLIENFLLSLSLKFADKTLSLKRICKARMLVSFWVIIKRFPVKNDNP